MSLETAIVILTFLASPIAAYVSVQISIATVTTEIKNLRELLGDMDKSMADAEDRIQKRISHIEGRVNRLEAPYFGRTTGEIERK